MKSIFFVIDKSKRISHIATITILAAALILTGFARADVITFDDIDTSVGINGQVGIADVPTNYHAPALTWTGQWTVLDNQVYNAAYDNTKTFPSTPNVVMNSGNQTVTLASSSLFNIQGAYFGGGSEYDEECWATALSLTVTGYNNGTVVGTRTFDLAPGQLQWQDIYINGVNRVDFSVPFPQEWFLMDNLTITTSDCRLPGNPLCQLSPMTRTSYNVVGYAGSRFTFDFADPTLLTGTVSWPGGIEHGQVDGLYAFYPTTIAATLDGAGKQVTLGRVGIDGGLGGLQWIWDAACGTTCPGGVYSGQVLPAWDNVNHTTPLASESFQIIPIPTIWAHNRFPTSGYVLLPTDRPQTPDASCVDSTTISDIPSDPGCTGPNNSCGRTEASCRDVMQGAGLTKATIMPGTAHFVIETFGELTPPVTFYVQFPYEVPDAYGCSSGGPCRTVYPPVMNTFTFTVDQ